MRLKAFNRILFRIVYKTASLGTVSLFLEVDLKDSFRSKIVLWSRAFRSSPFAFLLDVNPMVSICSTVALYLLCVILSSSAAQEFFTVGQFRS